MEIRRIFLSVFLWQTCSIFLSLEVGDHVWQPYNSAGITQVSKTSLFVDSFIYLSNKINFRLQNLFETYTSIIKN
jgi:hypothetical protein